MRKKARTPPNLRLSRQTIPPPIQAVARPPGSPPWKPWPARSTTAPLPAPQSRESTLSPQTQIQMAVPIQPSPIQSWNWQPPTRQNRFPPPRRRRKPSASLVREKSQRLPGRVPLKPPSSAARPLLQQPWLLARWLAQLLPGMRIRSPDRLPLNHELSIPVR